MTRRGSLPPETLFEARGSDSALEQVFESLVALDRDFTRMAMVLRETLDQLYDGQNTGRYRWDQLYKTEKTHCGTLVEINLQREFLFTDGEIMDFNIEGHEVDCKYSQGMGKWMIPNEAVGQICLVLTADDNASLWSAGLVRPSVDLLGLGRNRDAKATLNPAGRRSIRWIAQQAQLPPNILLSLPPDDVRAILSGRSGQARVNELFRRAVGKRISRGVVATVARQDDFMKRVRYNGGAREHLRSEGILIFGHYDAHAVLASQLGLPVPSHGESVSARVRRAEPRWSGRAIELEGHRWRLANDGDPYEMAPLLTSVVRTQGDPL